MNREKERPKEQCLKTEKTKGRVNGSSVFKTQRLSAGLEWQRRERGGEEPRNITVFNTGWADPKGKEMKIITAHPLLRLKD